MLIRIQIEHDCIKHIQYIEHRISGAEHNLAGLRFIETDLDNGIRKPFERRGGRSADQLHGNVLFRKNPGALGEHRLSAAV